MTVPFEIGDLELDATTGVLRCGDATEQLQPVEVRILMLLAVSPAPNVSEDMIRQHLYGERSRCAEIVRVYISRMRAKMQRLGSRVVIAVRWGQGYRLEAGPPVATRAELIAGLRAAARDLELSGMIGSAQRARECADRAEAR